MLIHDDRDQTVIRSLEARVASKGKWNRKNPCLTWYIFRFGSDPVFQVPFFPHECFDCGIVN